MKGSILEGFAGLGIRFAVLFFLMLGAASPAYAGQSGAPPPPANAAAPARAAAPAAAASAARPPAPAGQAVAAAEPAPKGNQEGIKIHGHWTIEVKNPDGKLVTHREFENSLAPSGAGAGLLAAFLGGAVTPGSWYVLIRDTATLTSNLQNTMVIAQANSAASNFCTNGYGPSCSATPLSVTAPVFNPALASFTGTTLTLAGSATVPGYFTAASIGYVETDNMPCHASNSPQACVALPSPPASIIDNLPFTARSLDGLSGDPAAVPVTVGQIVNVTVVISFQ